MRHLSPKQVYTVIRRRMRELEPFSLIRLGDGEARLMGYPDLVERKDLDTSIRYWYGTHQLTDDQVLSLRSELIAAIENADILGLPSAYQQNKNRFYQIVWDVAERENLIQENVTEANIHKQMCELGLLGELLAGLDRVALITCRDLGDKLKEKYNIGVVRMYSVPVEGHTGKPRERHYPEFHAALLDRLVVHPGELFLIGAGPNGKVYCDAVKRAGGVALDIGSVFDGWAGVPSRSYILQNLEAYRL